MLKRKKQLKRTGFMRRKTRLVSKTPLKRKNSGQMAMFIEIWESTPEAERKCFVTGDDLNHFHGTNKFHHLFQHVLNKNYHTKWKLEKNNIVLLRPDVHALIDQGTIDQRRLFCKETGHSFEEYYKLKERLKEEYERDSKFPRRPGLDTV